MVATAARQVVRSLLPRAVLNWREAQYYGRHGEVELHLLEFLCRRDQDAIDVGANFGGYVHFMRRYARRVLAYEPMPDSSGCCRKNFRAMSSIDSIALSDRTGTAELRMPVIDGMTLSGCSTISPDAAATYPAHRTIEVRTDRLDNIYDDNAGFIKIDVEGHEQAVLDGAVDTIRRCLPRLLVELDEHLSPGGAWPTPRRSLMNSATAATSSMPAGSSASSSFPLSRCRSPPTLPDLKSTLRDRPRFDNYINNFIFLPPGEPDETPRRISERLARL